MSTQNIKIGIIGGSGLAQALSAQQGQSLTLQTPFGNPSSPIVQLQWQNAQVFILQRHGPGHTLNPSAVPYRANIYALKKCGVTHIIASGATGSLRQNIKPGDLVIPDQIIDKTYKRENTFYQHAAVHVEMSQPFCPITRQWLLNAAKNIDPKQINVHTQGTYITMEGPAFSTKAESIMHRAWGADLVGMTAMPEAKLAKEAQIAYALIALPTDYDSWKPHQNQDEALLQEIIGNLNKASNAGITLIKKALQDLTHLQQNPSPAHHALKLAIWSDKTKIDPQKRQDLSLLWGQYFQ